MRAGIGQTVTTMRKCIEDHGEYLCRSETRTRLFLVNPMLQASGWDIYIPDHVELEYSAWKAKWPETVKVGGKGSLLKKPEYYEVQIKTAKKVDYALMKPDGKPIAMIEAKRLGTKLDNHKSQLFGYVARSEVQYAGLTNGDRWMIYQVIENSRKKPRIQLVMDVSIMSNTLRECVEGLEALWSLRLTCEDELYGWRQSAFDFKAQAGEI